MIDNIFITHGIFVLGHDASYERRSFFKMIRDKSNARYIPIPLKFRNLLMDKAFKWMKNRIEFTIARDPDIDVAAVAIVHPLDQFSRKIGRAISTGRLKKARGDFGYTYNELPNTVYKLER